ncbi:MAG TPA: sigma-70 family RNA polymerase sigma factor [Candidatus Limnocylindrales bacterium]|nr:sigma-70 family RNA polymerase sigma factor [Candidatus Limnocylindrales bacterium]
METSALVLRAQQGDHDAFAALAASAVPRLDKVARLIVRDPDVAQDAVQESLFLAWRDLRGLRDPDRWDAWLNRLTARACVALARSRRRRAVEVALGDIDRASPADIASGVAERQLVDDALRRLEPDRRALVVMHVYLGMALPEVADALGIPLGTAKSRLSRSLLSLRVLLSEDTTPAPAARAADGSEP